MFLLVRPLSPGCADKKYAQRRAGFPARQLLQELAVIGY